MSAKPTLYEPVGKNRYCGPTAVAAITGISTDEAARLMREWSGRRAIKGAGLGELAAALRARGCNVTGSGLQFAHLEAMERPTLAAWLKTGSRPLDRHVVVVYRNHYGVLLGRRYLCAQSGGATSLADIPGRRGRMEGWFVVTLPEAPAPTIEPPKRAVYPQASALAKARRLATKHGIELERDRDGYWVTHPDFDDGDNDPCQGNHFCVGGDEVLQNVEAYVEAIEKRDAKLDPGSRLGDNLLAIIQRAGPRRPNKLAWWLRQAGVPATEAQVRGAAIRLVMEGRARWFRGALKLTS